MLGLAISAGTIYALVITLLVQYFPNEAIGFFNKEPQILELGTTYLKIGYIRKYELVAHIKELIPVPRDLMARAAKPILAITANEICWGLGTIIFALASAVLTVVGNAIGEVTLNILLINVFIIIPRVYTIVMIMGIFRGGGDTKYSLCKSMSCG